jgi:hypothetical protein
VTDVGDAGCDEVSVLSVVVETAFDAPPPAR